MAKLPFSEADPECVVVAKVPFLTRQATCQATLGKATRQATCQAIRNSGSSRHAPFCCGIRWWKAAARDTVLWAEQGFAER